MQAEYLTRRNAISAAKHIHGPQIDGVVVNRKGLGRYALTIMWIDGTDTPVRSYLPEWFANNLKKGK